MKRLMISLSSQSLELVLVACFALVAALTVGLNTLVTSRIIDDYLRDAEAERVARDMNLATAFYQLKLDEVAAISHRLVLDPSVCQSLPGATLGVEDALATIDQQITNKITVLALGGTHLIAVLGVDGNILAGRVLSPDGELSPLIEQGEWGSLPIIESALITVRSQAATEIIPVEFLAQVGLDDQAYIPLIDTPKAAALPYDSREGTAGLALVSVSPVYNANSQMIGAVLAAYLFNNDFTLVDRIRAAAGIDTVTIFFGDLRVSTNVMTVDGKRAVGTRVSQEVYDTVLIEGSDYEGRAFVVNDWFITRYEPLRDHQGWVVGSLYVGARESIFRALVQKFNERVALIALVCIVLASLVAVPISRLITSPIANLVTANYQLASGGMGIRIQPAGSRELVMLGHSFNKMAQTLQQTQKELLQKERLASMGQLAAGVAHEINNPLGTILLFADILYKELDEDDPRRNDFKLIVDETVRCKNIVADLLNFARQQELLAQETDIHEVLDHVVGILRRQTAFENIEIVRQFSPDLPHIQADPAQLQQMFINLLNNAAEAGTAGGAITIATQPVDNMQQVEIEIADTGCGIPPENLGKLFTPFFTTKALGKGTGLGLSIVYGIIKMHRGQISVKSEGSQGTTFTITLPVHSHN